MPELSSDIEMKENMDTNNFILNNKKNWPLNNQVIGTLSKQLNQRLESQLEAIEDTVRQFREQKYSEFEAYKERAQRDHKTLARLLYNFISIIYSIFIAIHLCALKLYYLKTH